MKVEIEIADDLAAEVVASFLSVPRGPAAAGQPARMLSVKEAAEWAGDKTIAQQVATIAAESLVGMIAQARARDVEDAAKREAAEAAKKRSAERVAGLEQIRKQITVV